jgi:ATP phosphoribosyltransferase
LTVALSKGRLLVPTVEFLARAGIGVPEDILESRRLLAPAGQGRHQFLIVKPMDLPAYVEHGIAEVGICGRDVLLELTPDLHQPLDLGFGRCRLVLAGKPEASRPNHNLLSNLRVATKFPRLAERYFRRRGVPAEVIHLTGSVELAPNLGLAEVILDLVETGQTLRENGLEILEEVAECTAMVVVNRAAYHLRQAEVQDLLQRMRDRAS